MTKKTDFEPPYYVINSEGQSHEFDTYSACVAFIKSTGGNMGDSHVQKKTFLHHISRLYYNSYSYYTWIIRDALGNAVTFDHAASYGKHKKVFPYSMSTRYAQHRAAFSNGLPVPGTGCRRYGYCYRRPRHIGIERAHEGFTRDCYHDEDTQICLLYGKIDRMHTPPNAWDDEPISSRNMRCWKNQRKTHWRSKH